MHNPLTINPIDFPGGELLLLPGGRCVLRLDPVPPDAGDAAREYMNVYTNAVAALGHTVVVGGKSTLAMAAAAVLNKDEDDATTLC